MERHSGILVRRHLKPVTDKRLMFCSWFVNTSLCDALSTTRKAPAIRDITGRPGTGLEYHLQRAAQDLVIIMLGTNDIGRGSPAEHILDFVTSIHEVAHDRGIPTIAVAPSTVRQGQPRTTRS